MSWPSLKNVLFQTTIDNNKILWVYPHNYEFAGDFIFVQKSPNIDAKKTHLVVNTVDGKKLAIVEWKHENSNNLFQATGINLKNKHLSYIVIGLDFEIGMKNTVIIKKVLYKDKEPQSGSLFRGNNISRLIASREKSIVFLYRKTIWGNKLLRF